MEERKNRKVETMRKPFQGTWNIIRFNWHFYLLALGLLLLLTLLAAYVEEPLRLVLYLLSLGIISTTLLSLLVSCYVYDFSELYTLEWLNGLKVEDRSSIVNIHAGFDETSVLLSGKFGSTAMSVLDFYDPAQHTEVSIKRARKAYPPYPGTIKAASAALPLPDNSTDTVFVIFSAHEIRNEEERTAFFKELNRVIKPAGQIVVTEHLRDTVNFLAYTIGFFHFYSKASWLKVFQSSALSLQKEVKVTPFISTFILTKYGASS